MLKKKWRIAHSFDLLGNTNLWAETMMHIKQCNVYIGAQGSLFSPTLDSGTVAPYCLIAGRNPGALDVRST